jgi:hypothetical protein
VHVLPILPARNGEAIGCLQDLCSFLR